MSSTPFAEAQLSESVSKLASTGEPKIHLYTVGTPNGHKASILLEELIAAYPNDKNAPLYDFIPISFAENTQKTPEFLKINPNGRIPALIDDNVQVEGGKGHNVFESVSIMLWLVEKYDKENKFWFGQEESVLRSKGFSWMFFGHGGIGPMQGQANHFFRYAPEKIPYGIKRYQEETKRLYSVLEDGLKEGKGEYLVGDKFTIVDMSIFPWVRGHNWCGVEDMSAYPLVNKWLERIEARPGTYAGLGIPSRAPTKKLSKEEEEAKAEEAKKWIHSK